jgi:hypothetical protein
MQSWLAVHVGTLPTAPTPSFRLACSRRLTSEVTLGGARFLRRLGGRDGEGLHQAVGEVERQLAVVQCPREVK